MRKSVVSITLLLFLVGCGGGGGNGGNSSISNTQPSSPTGVVTVPSNSQVTVSWDNVSGATSYNLYMASVSFIFRYNTTHFMV